MSRTEQPHTEKTPYATKSDFCRILNEQMASLYQLSLLLTLDEDKAERCFVAAIVDCGEANHIFREWANSWTRRTIIQNAIQLIALAPNRASQTAQESETLRIPGWRELEKSDYDGLLTAVKELPSLERFVFVMSVLERISDQDCSVLLGCSRRDIAATRVRAIQQIAKSTGTKHAPTTTFVLSAAQ